jgi:hypothetical protein
MVVERKRERPLVRDKSGNCEISLNVIYTISRLLDSKVKYYCFLILDQLLAWQLNYWKLTSGTNLSARTDDEVPAPRANICVSLIKNSRVEIAQWLGLA